VHAVGSDLDVAIGDLCAAVFAIRFNHAIRCAVGEVVGAGNVYVGITLKHRFGIVGEDHLQRITPPYAGGKCRYLRYPSHRAGKFGGGTPAEGLRTAHRQVATVGLELNRDRAIQLTPARIAHISDQFHGIVAICQQHIAIGT